MLWIYAAMRKKAKKAVLQLIVRTMEVMLNVTPVKSILSGPTAVSSICYDSSARLVTIVSCNCLQKL